MAVVDLQQARPGSRLFHLRNEEVRSPFGVEVAQVIPGTLGIELERTLRRVVPVVAPTEGDPAPGFVVGPVTAEPATVEIAGPESRVKKLANATTEPVTVTGARDNVRDVVTVGSARLLGPAGQTAGRDRDRGCGPGAGRARAPRGAGAVRAISAAAWCRRRSGPARSR